MKKFTLIRKLLPYLLFISVILIIFSDLYYTNKNKNHAYQKLYNQSNDEFVKMSNHLSKFFSLNYYSLRSISMLNSVKKITSKSKFKKTNGIFIAQQFFNQLALVNNVSEIYISPLSVIKLKDVSKINEIIINFDDIKLDKSEKQSFENQESDVEEYLEFDEIKSHLKYFSKKFSTRASFKAIKYPMLCGRDDTYIGGLLPRFKKNSFVCSMPIYDMSGRLHGITSLVLKNVVLEQILKNNRFYLFKTNIVDINELKKKNFVINKHLTFYNIKKWSLLYISPRIDIENSYEIKKVNQQNNIMHIFVFLLLSLIFIIFIFQTDNKSMRSLNTKLNNEINQRRESEERLEQFTSDAGHEIRSPIAVIKAEVEIHLKKDRSVKEYKNSLKNILTMSNRLEKIVTNLLHLATQEDGFILNNQILNLKTTMNQYIQTFYVLYPNKPITIHNNIPDNIDVMFDKDQIEQVTINLLNNSLKYSENDTIIDISYDEFTNKDNIELYRINFKDNGTGIPEDKLKNIYDRFFRVDKVRTIGKDGLGLGLSICKKIIDAHQGTINIKNNISTSGICVSLTFTKIIYE